MVGVSAINFQFNGREEPDQPLNFKSPAYGLAYSRANLSVSLLLGQQNSSDTTSNDLSLVDFSLALWGEVFFSEAATSAPHRIYAPIMLFSNYRKVKPSGINILGEFNMTTIGLGIGLGYYGAFGDNAQLEMRSTPALGYAFQSFGDAGGLAKVLDNDVQLHIGSVFGDKIGVSVGYALRLIVWNLKVSGSLASLSDELYDYRDLRHVFSLGLNW